MIDTIHLMVVYSKTIAKAWFQYRVDAVLRSLAVFLREATGIMVIYFTLLKFDTLNESNIYEMFFIKHLTPKKISMILNRPFGTIKKICYGERCNDIRKKFLENTEIK